MRRLLVVPLLTVALAACGGDGDSLSASDYRAQAGDICRKANAKLKAFDDPSSIGEFHQLAKKAKPIVADAVDDLRDLKPPENLQDAHDRWLGLEDRIVDGLDEVQDAKTEEDVVRFAGKYGAIENEADEVAARDLGIKACAED